MGDVCKCAVAAIVIERIAGGVMFARDVGIAAFGEAGPIHDVEIEEAVAVEVAPGGRRAFAGVAYPGALGHIGEAVTAIIVK